MVIYMNKDEIQVLPVFIDDGRPGGQQFSGVLTFKSDLNEKKIMRRFRKARKEALTSEEETCIGLIMDKFMEKEGITPVEHHIPTSGRGISCFVYDNYHIEETDSNEY